MNAFLQHFAPTIAKNVHVVMVLDGAGWHARANLDLPDNITLVSLPPYSPELNPVERVWLYLRERFLSLRLLEDQDAIVEACCQAWCTLIEEPKRIKSLCNYPWIQKVNS